MTCHPHLLVVAGEASGDLHGARMLSELDRLEPNLRAFGLGGDELRAAGLETVADCSEISVMGLKEVIKVIPRAREIFAKLLKECERRQPAAAVLIDFPEFNLRLARALNRRGVPVVYYISPQIWAWRRRRVKAIAASVDKMLVLFPFEVDFYRDHAVDVKLVGHPLLDEVPRLEGAWDREVSGPFRVTLMPGSRRNEIEALLPALLAAAAAIGRSMPARFKLIRAPGIAADRLEAAIGEAGLEIEVISRNRFEVMAESHLVLCTSGTATLEVGLVGTPLIVVYRTGWWSHKFGRLLVKLPNVSLVNLVLGREAVPELLQGDATAERIAAEALEILGDAERVRRMREDLRELRGRLGPAGGSREAARQIAPYLTPVSGADQTSKKESEPCEA